MAKNDANSNVNPEYQLAIAGGFTGTEEEFLKIQSRESSETVETEEVTLDSAEVENSAEEIPSESGKNEGEKKDTSSEKPNQDTKPKQEKVTKPEKKEKSQQDKNPKEFKSYLVVKSFKDSKQYVPNGYVAETYAVGDSVSHFDEDRINSLLERKLIKEI